MISKILFIQLGKFKSKDYENLFNEYIKRLEHYVKVEIRELRITKDDPLHVNNLMDKLFVILKGNKIMGLSEYGKSIDSNEFSKLLEAGNGTLSVVVGTSWGLPDYVQKNADYMLSFGKMTMPHEAVRVMIAEQLYRGYTIIRGESYHK